MLSISLTRDFVYSAFALSLVLALGTIAAALWGVARARARRWPWAWAAPIAAGVLTGWLWFYPSFVIGAAIGGDLGAAVGHHFSPVADAAIMAGGIGLGIYLVFTGPLAAVMLVTALAVTKARPASDKGSQAARARAAPRRPWGVGIGRPVLASLARAYAVALSAMRYHASLWERARRHRVPRAG